MVRRSSDAVNRGTDSLPPLSAKLGWLAAGLRRLI
jgi:hypothetical protein